MRRVQNRLKQLQRRRQFWQFSGSALATVALVVLGVAMGWLVGRVGSLPERPSGPAVTPMLTASPLPPDSGDQGAGLASKRASALPPASDSSRL